MHQIMKILWILSTLVVSINCYAITDAQNSNQSENAISSSSISAAKNSPRNGNGNSIANDNSINEDSSTNQAELEQYWLNQRDSFFNLTTFNLSKVSSSSNKY